MKENPKLHIRDCAEMRHGPGRAYITRQSSRLISATHFKYTPFKVICVRAPFESALACSHDKRALTDLQMSRARCIRKEFHSSRSILLHASAVKR